jgi:outer membrane receptor protein involved in Fe transport
MPERRTNITLNIENIFDRDPEFYASGSGYHTAGLLNPYGRNFKVSIQKSF